MEEGFHLIAPDQRSRKQMNENIVTELVINYLRLWRNHQFRIGNITSKGEKFEVSATDEGGAWMDKMFVVDKHTGWVQSFPGHNR